MAELAHKTDCNNELRQERAYIAASRRTDRSLEARVESARKASEVHRRRTGRGLRITEEEVLNDRMYEEIEDLPHLYYQQLTHHLTTGPPEHMARMASYLSSNITLRNALNQAINLSHDMGANADASGSLSQAISVPTFRSALRGSSAHQTAYPPVNTPAPQGPIPYAPTRSSISSPSTPTVQLSLPCVPPPNANSARFPVNGTEFYRAPLGWNAFHPLPFEDTPFRRSQIIRAPAPIISESPVPSPTVLSPEQSQRLDGTFPQEPAVDGESVIKNTTKDLVSHIPAPLTQTTPGTIAATSYSDVGSPERQSRRRKRVSAHTSRLSLRTLVPNIAMPRMAETPQKDNRSESCLPSRAVKRKALSESPEGQPAAKAHKPIENVSPSPIARIAMPAAADEQDHYDFFDFSLPQNIQDLLAAPEFNAAGEMTPAFGACLGRAQAADLKSAGLACTNEGKPGETATLVWGGGGPAAHHLGDKGLNMGSTAFAQGPPTMLNLGPPNMIGFEPGNLGEFWAEFFGPRAVPQSQDASVPPNESSYDDDDVN
ncbi:hypothetical protein DRE_02875 [Drechslerella stenobrocha 248]|uniref:Uncharacterized protein n=1 Tax=Drechslerella stenobrocha 248 TaxID=1043628 RepID=W7I6W1_9PEZI|nr:hypothetical protein DRE_02875 [Drechslerella stenobrocha 248]